MKQTQAFKLTRIHFRINIKKKYQISNSDKFRKIFDRASCPNEYEWNHFNHINIEKISIIKTSRNSVIESHECPNMAARKIHYIVKYKNPQVRRIYQTFTNLFSVKVCRKCSNIPHRLIYHSLLYMPDRSSWKLIL